MNTSAESGETNEDKQPYGKCENCERYYKVFNFNGFKLCKNCHDVTSEMVTCTYCKKQVPNCFLVECEFYCKKCEDLANVTFKKCADECEDSFTVTLEEIADELNSEQREALMRILEERR